MRSPFGRRREAADPYAGAAERLERSRQAREELGDPTVASPYAMPPMRRPGGRYIWAVLILVLVVGFGLSGRKPAAPKLARNCDTAGMKLSDTTPRLAGPVTWAATGPDGQYALTVDVTALSRRPDGSIAVAQPRGKPTWAGPRFSIKDCTATGRFALNLPAGPHTVRLFHLTPTGDEVVATQQIRLDS